MRLTHIPVFCFSQLPAIIGAMWGIFLFHEIKVSLARRKQYVIKRTDIITLHFDPLLALSVVAKVCQQIHRSDFRKTGFKCLSFRHSSSPYNNAVGNGGRGCAVVFPSYSHSSDSLFVYSSKCIIPLLFGNQCMDDFVKFQLNYDLDNLKVRYQMVNVE